jgi:hypothetical protein
MPWTTLTADHVSSRLSARELETLEDVATREYLDASGEEPAPTTPSDRVGEIIAQVVARIRGAILANPRVEQLGPPGTIPEFLVFSAATLARTALMGMPPSDETMSDPRRDEARNAEREIERLSSMDPRAFALGEIAPNSAPAFGGAPLLQF